jgi:hypothetical protein
VAEYRAFTVGDDGHFVGYEPLICYNDDDAIAKASSLMDGHDIELWSGTRLVIRLTAPNSRSVVTHEIKDGRMIPKK